MNATEQKARATLGEQLRSEMAQTVKDVELIVQHYHDGLQVSIDNVIDTFEKNKTHNEEVAKELDVRIQTMFRSIEIIVNNTITFKTEPLRRGFWGRIQWLLTGN